MKMNEIDYISLFLSIMSGIAATISIVIVLKRRKREK